LPEAVLGRGTASRDEVGRAQDVLHSQLVWIDADCE